MTFTFINLWNFFFLSFFQLRYIHTDTPWHPFFVCTVYDVYIILINSILFRSLKADDVSTHVHWNRHSTSVCCIYFNTQTTVDFGPNMKGQTSFQIFISCYLCALQNSQMKMNSHAVCGYMHNMYVSSYYFSFRRRFVIELCIFGILDNTERLKEGLGEK